ncbi:hypothetical protein BDA99DRAFT_498207 [Phascolomyces articulosus]|uniref:Uncharacterized protein n=1 Tax=Phascolomyces articulosus TaxID=60185 RepID=A0AAD5PK21_9FUNG|nr:hypothetical protein BDA99DRAFT_498207 [Phascolomyces articulosus]
MTVGYMPQTYYVQQQHQQQPQQQQRRGKPLPQIPVSIEPMLPRSISPYYGSMAGFPPPQPHHHHPHHPLPPAAMASNGPSPCSSLILPPPSSIPSKRHSYSELSMIHLGEPQPQQQQHGMERARRYSMGVSESNKIEEEEIPGLESSSTRTMMMQKPFDPSYEPMTTTTSINNNNHQNKIFQIPNTPDDDLVVSTTSATRSNSCLSPSTTSPATPTCQTGTIPSKIPSPWGSRVSLALRDNNEDDGEALPSPITPLTTEPQPIVMEEQPIDQVPLPTSLSMEQKRSLPPVPIGISKNNNNHDINKNEPPPTAIHVAVADLIQQQQKQQPLEHQLEQLENAEKKKAQERKDTSTPRFTCIVASYSLTHQKDAIKTYRRMAIKTKNKQVQLAYAKYLLDVARLYEENASTRQRLLKEGKYWISRLAKKNIWEAVFLHGQHYLEARQPSKATRCFEKAAQHGYSDAYFALAEQAEEQKDWTKALACYRSAADGHPAANYKMAMVLLRQNMNPIQVLEKAAKGVKTIESGKAALVLSNIYSHILKTREHVEKDEAKAFRYLKQAFQFDITEAVYRMGEVYTYGLLGQSKDAWQGYQCFMKSAEEGYDVAMLELAKVYAKGIQGYLSSQPDVAFRWCQRAAERGLKEAEFTLGTYYEIGVGITIDYPRALEYFGKAASKGHVEAAGKLNRPVVKPSIPSSSNKKLPSTSITTKTVQRYQPHQVERCCIM